MLLPLLGFPDSHVPCAAFDSPSLSQDAAPGWSLPVFVHPGTAQTQTIPENHKKVAQQGQITTFAAVGGQKMAKIGPFSTGDASGGKSHVGGL